MKIELNLEKLTLREMEDFETASGMAIGDVGSGKSMSARALRALVWIAQRRADPAFTFEDAGDVEVSALDFGGGENPPE